MGSESSNFFCLELRRKKSRGDDCAGSIQEIGQAISWLMNYRANATGVLGGASLSLCPNSGELSVLEADTI